eukprot:scaffold439_cov415-Prasinococcus_capsulatus_cf.AAC.13
MSSFEQVQHLRRSASSPSTLDCDCSLAAFSSATLRSSSCALSTQRLQRSLVPPFCNCFLLNSAAGRRFLPHSSHSKFPAHCCPLTALAAILCVVLHGTLRPAPERRGAQRGPTPPNCVGGTRSATALCSDTPDDRGGVPPPPRPGGGGGGDLRPTPDTELRRRTRRLAPTRDMPTRRRTATGRCVPMGQNRQPGLPPPGPGHGVPDLCSTGVGPRWPGGAAPFWQWDVHPLGLASCHMWGRALIEAGRPAVDLRAAGTTHPRQ